MTAEAQKIFEQALALPPQERAALVGVLTESLHGIDDDLSPEWKAEIARRVEAVKRGESRIIPGDEVAGRIRARLSRSAAPSLPA